MWGSHTIWNPKVCFQPEVVLSRNTEIKITCSRIKTKSGKRAVIRQCVRLENHCPWDTGLFTGRFSWAKEQGRSHKDSRLWTTPGYLQPFLDASGFIFPHRTCLRLARPLHHERKTVRVSDVWSVSQLLGFCPSGEIISSSNLSLQDKFSKNVFSRASWIPVTKEWTVLFLVIMSHFGVDCADVKPNLCESNSINCRGLEVKENGRICECSYVWWCLLSLCSRLPPQRTPPSSAPSWEMLQFLILSGRGMCQWPSSTDRALQKYWWVALCTGLRENIGIDRIPRHRWF